MRDAPLLSVFFLVGIVQVAALRGKVVAGFGLSLITAAALLVTPKLMTSLIPVTWLSRYLGEHPGLRRAAASHALRTELSYSQAFLIQGGLAITTRDFKNLPAGSDWCRPMELDLERVLGNEAVWKLAGLLSIAGTLITALSL
jgi:hypothetical protein